MHALPAYADLVGVQAEAEGSQRGGSAAKDRLEAAAAAAVAAAKEGLDPQVPPAKRVRLELPPNLAAAAAAAVASGNYDELTAAAAAAGGGPDCGCFITPAGRLGSSTSLQRLASQAAVPALSVSRLERELEKALRAFIRIK